MRAVAEIETEPSRIDQNFDHRRRIAQREIDALSGDRMHAVRGIPDERETVRDQLAREA